MEDLVALWAWTCQQHCGHPWPGKDRWGKNSAQFTWTRWCLVVLIRDHFLPGIAIAERLAPFKVKKFIYTDVAPRPELASTINAEYGKKCGVMSWEGQWQHTVLSYIAHRRYYVCPPCYSDNSGGIVSLSSVLWWAGKAVGFPGRLLCFNSRNQGNLQ